MGKTSFALFLLVIILLACLFLGVFSFGHPYGIWTGLAFGFPILGYLARYFLISVPPATGGVTLNLFTGELSTYKKGLHIIYPFWEKIDRMFGLEIEPNEFEEHDEDGKEKKGFRFPMNDGPEIVIFGSYQYQADEILLDRYIMVDEKTIRDGIRDMVSGVMAHWTAKKTAVGARNEVRELSIYVDNYFSKERNENEFEREGTQKRHTIESNYGIDIKWVAVSKIVYEKRFQKARSTEKVMRVLQDTAKKTLFVEVKDSDGKKVRREIPYADQMDNVLLVNEPGVTKHIQKTQGQGGEALASLLMAMATGGGKNAKRSERSEKEED